MQPVSKFTPSIRRERTDLNRNKDPAHVYCRLRPLKDNADSTCISVLSANTLSLTTPLESKAPRKEVQCKFHEIFTAYSLQDEVFQRVAYPLVVDLLKGKNGLLFTYGVTGSGKTYTLAGNPDNPGIIPQTIYTVFNSISHQQAPKYLIKSDNMNGFEIQSQEDAMQDKLKMLRTASKTPRKATGRDKLYKNDGSRILDIDKGNLFSVFVSYIEIYNNTVYDLLDESSLKNSLQTKMLREDGNKNMYVFGVVEVEVKSAEEAFEMFTLGQKRKKMGNTILNAVSSRSHSIFNIRVVQFQHTSYNEEGQAMIPASNVLTISQLSLVDLAGSERTNRTQNTGQLLKEASQINNSLLSLRTCLEILRENQTMGSNKIIPYRDNRLTLYFKNYFEGGGRVCMIVCINPSIDDFEENFQVVKFAEVTQAVKIARSEPKYTPCKKIIKKKAPLPKDSYCLGPEIPRIKFIFENFEEARMALEKVRYVTKTRDPKCKEYNQMLEQVESNFRKRLLEFEQENTLDKSEIKRLKLSMRKDKQRVGVLEAKLVESETAKVDLNEEIKGYKNEITALRQTLSEKDVKINRNIIEKEKTKQKMALQTEKMTQELDAKLRRQREHLNAAMRAKETKIQRVKEILDREITPPEVPLREIPTVKVDLYETPKQQSRRAVGTPAVRRRRSRSAGEGWLEHNAVKPVPLGTVLQPTMKKKKSVTKLTKATDVTNPKQSKYCLIAQDQDTDGEVETRVYKGDIVPTCGGGAQVIFNDVEKLTQESPTAN